MSAAPSFPWVPGAVTGLGSLPGTDPGEATALVLGELPDLPHLPELPDRGPGAGMIGRTAALLVDLPAEIGPTGWRLTGRPGRDVRRARDDLARDLDALEERTEGYTGPLKVQVAGPWTLAASVELANGNLVLTDDGAVRDLAASLAEGVREQLADLARRVPGAVPVLQVDEPSLPAVLAGRIPTASGYGTVRAVERATAEQTLAAVLGVAGTTVLHCCAPGAPIELLATADAVSLDAALLSSAHYDALGEAVDAGTSLWLGVIPSTGPVSYEAGRDRVRTLWSELGFAPGELARSVVPTPACGLAGQSPERARRVLRSLRDVGRSLAEQ